MNILAYVHLRNIYGSTGAGRVARQLVEHLSAQPDTRIQILADPGDHSRIVPLIGAPWSQYQYRFIARETSRQQAEWALFSHPKAEQYWPEADVTFCTAESYVPTRRSRLAVTLHDAAFFEQGAHRASAAFWKQRIKWSVLYKILAHRADMFHTVSHFSAERLAHFFPSIRTRLRVVHNGVPPRFFQPESAAGQREVRELGLAERPFILLPRGLAHRKNADLVLRSWPRLREREKDLQLVITSHCDAGYAEQAQALGSSVTLTGFVSDEALCSLYHAAQAVWFPSLYEGFGLPVLEAMACGAPVVASNSSSLPEVAGSAALLVSPHRDDEHIEALSSLLRNAGLRSRCVADGLQRAAGFTWSASARQLRQYLAELN